MEKPVFKSADAADGDTMVRLGQTLQYEREKQGLIVEEVARQLCLAESVIRNLEAGDTEALPETVYVRGYIRAYCKLLKIDPAPLLEEVELVSTEHGEDDFLPAMNEEVHHLTRLWGTLAVVSIMVVLIYMWWREQPHQFEPLPQTPFSETSVPVGKAPLAYDHAAEAGTELIAVTIRAEKRSWAHITDGSGDVIINRELFPGYHKEIYGVLPFDFKFGDARGLRMWLDGVEYDLSGHTSDLNTAFFRLEQLDQ